MYHHEYFRTHGVAGVRSPRDTGRWSGPAARAKNPAPKEGSESLLAADYPDFTSRSRATG